MSIWTSGVVIRDLGLPFLTAMGTPGQGNPIVGLLPMVAIVVIIYFIILRPMKRQQQKVQEFREALKNGDRVRVRNSFGEVVATLAVSDDIPPGVASMPKGMWRRSTHNRWTANALAPDHVDAQGGGACYNDARVEIERAGA